MDTLMNAVLIIGGAWLGIKLGGFLLGWWAWYKTSGSWRLW